MKSTTFYARTSDHGYETCVEHLVTDVCIKRKIRDYVQMAMDEQAPWRIYIQNRRTLNRLDSEALEAEHIDARPEDKDFAKEIKALKKDDPTLDLRLRDYMCSQFFDIRRK